MWLGQIRKLIILTLVIVFVLVTKRHLYLQSFTKFLLFLRLTINNPEGGSDNFVLDEQAVNNPESGLEVVVDNFTWAVPWSW